MVEALAAEATTRVSGLRSYMTDLREAYDGRLTFWSTELDDPENRDLLADADRAAQRFFAAYETAFLPAVDGADVTRARAVLNRELAGAYTEHRVVVDPIAARTTSQTALVESGARSTASSTMRLPMVLASRWRAGRWPSGCW